MQLLVIKTEPLKGNDVAPPLYRHEIRDLKKVIYCKCGNPHYDVGIPSNYNYISCHDCGSKLPGGDMIHWCHPSRFEELD